MINNDENHSFSFLHNENEIWDNLNNMNSNSVVDPGAYTTLFFKFFCNIIKHDLISVVYDFFYGTPIPRFFTSTYFMLVLKKDDPNI